MNAYYTDTFVLPLPESHQFPMRKYRLLRERILDSGILPAEAVRVPEPAKDQDILLAHTRDYLHRVIEGELTRQEQRRIGFPWSPEMVERSRRSVGATIAATRDAIRDGISVNLAGGTHHAFADKGEGYCVFNDTVVAARVLQRDTTIIRVLVIDLDVHQGNGTASIAANDETIFTFSMHGAKNFPHYKEVSDLDVALDDGTNDETYLALLQTSLAEISQRFNPEFIFYLAGADPFHRDRFGRLNLSMEGLEKRDHVVFRFCEERDLPCVVSMAGGYSPDVEEIAAIHFQTVCKAVEFQRARVSHTVVSLKGSRT